MLKEILEMKINMSNFLSIKKANLASKNNIIVIIAPNRAGKTHLLMLIYSMFWSLWKVIKDENFNKFSDILKSKIKRTFLLKSLDELVSWDEKKYEIDFRLGNMKINITGIPSKIKTIDLKPKIFEKSPIYIQPSGMGTYYKGIYSMKKYYPHWRLITEAITDFLNDLLIVPEKSYITKESEELLDFFENLFKVKFYIQQDRIYVKEKRSYIIEKAATGLQTISWLYLAVKYDILGEILLIDEPEVNLHPEYIDLLSSFLIKLSNNKKIFIATHSDYLLESLNKQILKENIKIDVWEGVLKEKRAIYRYYQADKENLIDVSPLSKVYENILKESFGIDLIHN